MIVWKPHAIGDLQALQRYIAADNPMAASAVSRRIRDAATSLGPFPWRGRAGRVNGSRELVVSGTPYLIAYMVEGEDVIILRVIHGSQDWPDVL